MTGITFLGHSAVRVDGDDGRLVIDPGAFSDLSGLPTAEAVLVTHEHVDHLAPSVLDGAPAEVWAPEGVIAQLEQSGIPAPRLHTATPGDSFDAAGMTVTVFGGQHAEIYPGLPAITNNAYLVEGRVLHPGDSFAPVPDPASVQVLLLPVAAPWLKLAEAITYARGFPNATVCPIHDAMLSDSGRQLTDRVITTILGAERYRRFNAGETMTVRR